MSAGKFIIGANHIGNVRDIPVRVLEAIDNADIILAEYLYTFKEDMIYLNRDHKRTIIEYRDSEECHNQVFDLLNSGKNILFLVQHGYPGTADMGGNLINKLIKQNYDVEIIPGPSVVPVAVAVSGIVSDQDGYTFKSFFDDEDTTILTVLEEIKDIKHTLVLIDKAPKTKRMLELMLETFGDREISVCLNIGDSDNFRWKHKQQILIGSISEMINKLGELKSDIMATVVCKGKSLV